MAPNKFVTAATVVAKFLLAFLIPFRFFSSLLAAFSLSRLVYRTQYDYVDEDTSWHFAIGTAKSGLGD